MIVALGSLAGGAWVFDDPGWLWLAVLVPIAVWIGHRGGSPAVRFSPGVGSDPVRGGADDRGSKPGSDRMPVSLRARLLFLPPVLFIAGLLLVIVALSRPQDRTPLPREAEGIDILLCVDTSSSMDARDMDADRTRLDVARHAALRFVASRPHDRLGLVSFARYTDVRCPPTRDHQALAAFLADLRLVERNCGEDMTAIGAAIALSARVLRASQATSKVVILLTDGAENVASDQEPDEIGPLPAAQLCDALGVRVYTIAVGRDQNDGAGTTLPLDTRQVREVARRTGGAFLEARDADGLERVYQTIDELETTRFEDPRHEVVDRFRAVLLVALGLICAGYLLRLLGLEASP